MTDVFKGLGLYNNDSSSLTSANAAAAATSGGDAAGGAFIATGKKLPGPEATYRQEDSFSWIEPYYPRDHAYTWPQYQVSNESAYLNDAPAGQHHYPYDTMESIRSRYQSRLSDNNDTRAYGNDNITATFRSLGLYNNDSSTLQAAAPAGGDAAGGSFIATKLRDPAAAATPAADPNAGKLHFYRHDAWNEANLNATHQKEYGTNPLTAHGATLPEHSTAGYVVEPLNIDAGQGGAAPAAAFIYSRGEPTLHFYRHEAWNEANLNATHQKEYGTNPLTAHGATLPEHSTDGYLVEPMNIAPAGGAGNPTGPSAGAAFIAKNNAAQGEPIEFLMRSIKKRLPGSEATYIQPDSFSWIEPYYPRDHAYTWPQYQVSNESAYLNDVPAGQH
jgi:hypothetical protein